MGNFGFNFNIGFNMGFCGFGINNWFMPNSFFMPNMFFNPMNNFCFPSFNPFFQYNPMNFWNNNIWNNAFQPQFYSNFNDNDNLIDTFTRSNKTQNTVSEQTSTIDEEADEPTTEKAEKANKTTNKQTVSSAETKTTTVSKPTQRIKINNKMSPTEIKCYGTLDDYNAEKGEKLIEIAMKNRESRSQSLCARYVKNAIQEAGLGEYKLGHAFEMPTILRNNPNFKQISTDKVDISKLPAGCILVYGKGVAGYSSEYGHTEITTGNGNAVSDYLHKKVHKKPSNIFIPV